ncbi:iron ABC transporter ATP-binding protein [Agromyces aerolatus]|uniref:iron ABC transporter ATP-binding protein n=1 Tax=Agromyces sp. LY-1074 TaxID=3074080 RepID=UPI00285B677D|nr:MULTISPECIES: iron ABC transporter ATP-binding protein [unclassified Agromyces]MDR5701807.1 iron ABC transporter ATP-binding protein [Agromyces sp. LY-1074]MDR5707523.1 iron ABC transporter ATP-binding protein [Agromyces sp. LY-1358]
MLRSDRPSRAALTWIALAAATGALLTGCTPGEAEPTATPSPTASATPEPTTPPTETAAPEESSPPFAIDCDALLTLEQLYVFNPNFGVDPSYEPDSATITQVVEQGGTACGYLNQTSGDYLQIAVATPTAAVTEAMAGAAASQSTPVPTYGTPPDVEGYFSQSGVEGQVQLFSGPYWVVMESSLLYEPGDAEQLAADVLGNLPAA